MATETVLIDFQVDYTELTNAQAELAKTGKIDTKGFDAIQNAIDTTATDSKGLIKTFKEVATASTKMGKTVEDAFGAGVQDALDQAGVSAEEFAAALKKANAPSQTLKKELQQLKEAMARMKAEGKDTGKEFDSLRKKAGQLADAIADTNAEIKNAGSDTRGLDNVVGSISALAGGYAAAQGVIALFGEENEDLQKALLKVNAALAAATGLQQVANALQKEGALLKLRDAVATGTQTAAIKLYTFATGGATAATNIFRTALLATGIGAIIFLLYEGAKALGIFGSSSSNAADDQDKLARSIEGVNTVIEEQIGAINSTAQTNIKRAKVAGKSEAEITKITRDAILERINFYDDENNFLRLSGQIANQDQVEVGKLRLSFIREEAKAREELRQFDLDNEVNAAEKRRDILIKAGLSLKAERDKLRADEKRQADLANQNALTAALARVNKELEQEFIAFENKGDIDAQLYEEKKKNAKDWDDQWKLFQESLVKSSEDAAKKITDSDAKLLRKRVENANIAISIGTQIAGIYTQIAAAQTARDNAAIESQRKRLQAELEAGVISQKQFEARNKIIDKQARDAFQKAAQREKNAALFTAALAIPKAFLQGLQQGGLKLAIVYAALAAVEAAFIASKPVPKFFRGKKDSYEGPGIVGDMGTELVEQGGRMFLYTKPTQTYLGAKDKVYTAAETRQIMHNTNISTTVKQQPSERFDYSKFAAAIPQGAVNINIDKDFISESVASGLQRTNYMDRRYSSK